MAASIKGTTKQTSIKKRSAWPWVVAIILIPLALFAAYTWFVLNWSYSSGDRAGYVQKFSKKGWVCKTWEGELALISLPGAAPEKFYFTIMDDAVAAQVMQVMGKRASLHYDEKVGLPTSCFGDSRYYVNKVMVSDEIPLAPGVVVHSPPAVPSPPSSPASAASR